MSDVGLTAQVRYLLHRLILLEKQVFPAVQVLLVFIALCHSFNGLHSRDGLFGRLYRGVILGGDRLD